LRSQSPHLFSGSLILFLIVWLSIPGNLQAHVEGAKEQPAIGLDEKLGAVLPTDITFRDEKGNPVNLTRLISTPTVLALVYYHCPNVCSLLLQRLAEALNRMPAQPGTEYSVISVSFDETETPDLALERKGIYLKMIGKSFPPESWKFLTGDRENIRKLTGAVGFAFRREGQDFEHPVALVLLSAEGKITRYLYGTDVLPFDLRMGLLEASEGRVGPTISKVLRFCFRYDPKGRQYVFNTLKVTGIATLSVAVSFMAFLLVKGRRPGIPKGK
jgi:protein SCO1